MATETAAEVLLVDRDPVLGREIVESLSSHNYGVEWVRDDEKAYNCLERQAYDVLVTELDLRRVDGMRLMGVAKSRHPDICVILIAENPDMDLATEAMRQGAYDFQTKPLNLGKLEAVIERGLGHQRLRYEQLRLQRQLDERYGLGSLIGTSRAIVNAYTKIRDAANSGLPVILVGEPGTGKDHAAQVLHNNSSRRDAPFVKLNCSAEHQTLVQRELLGHGANVYPDATEATPGRIELADHGTLYLDNVSAFPQLLYEQLLDTLETGTVQRVGETRSVRADIRLVVSVVPGLDPDDPTNTFLNELRHRCNALLVELPPLRERKEDIPVLVDSFIRAASREQNKRVAGIARGALDILMQQDWYENVRGLRNTIDGMVLSARGETVLDVMDVPVMLRESAAASPGEMRIPAGSSMSDIERIVIGETLKASGYNKEVCAKTLGIGLRTLYRKLKDYDLP